MECENSLILVEKPTDKVALITLNSPPLNLVTLEFGRGLKEALFRLEQDDEVRVVVLTGSGERALRVGSDIKEFPLIWDGVIGKKLQKENKVFNATEFLGKPIIVAMKGDICDDGYEMAMACDLRILPESGRITQPEINLGVSPGSGGIFRLSKLVGASRAMGMMFLGGFIDAEDCLRLGLVGQLAPAGKIVSAMFDLAERIARKPFEAIKLMKKGVREVGMVPSNKCFYKSLESSRNMFKTGDYREGADAFLGKRSPQFR